jgi:hypothetical protein
MEMLFETVTSLISIIGQSIKEADLNPFPGLLGSKQARNTETVRSLNMGTSNRLSLLNSRSILLWSTLRMVVKLLTFFVTKPIWSVPKRLVGGKIAEKANALGNAKDTGHNVSAFVVRYRGLISGLSPQNSVSLNKIAFKIPFGRAYSTQDLTSPGVSRSDAPSLSTPTIVKPPVLTIDEDKPLNIRERVELKQTELVRLAERYGLSDPRVHQAQLLMARSLLFRTHAANLMAEKAGSQTPGVDHEIIDKMILEESKGQLIL